MKDCIDENNAPLRRYNFILYIAIAVSTIAFTIRLGVYIARTNAKSVPKSNTDNQGVIQTKQESDVSDSKVLRLVTRDGWLAEPAKSQLDKLVLPVHRVIIHHTATENCTSQATCTYRMRVIQSFHMEARNFDDIAHNFLIGGDGVVYEGRGWDQIGAHTKGYNVDSISIGFIGTFALIPPPEKQLNAAKLLIEEGIRLNKLVNDYRLYGARQFIPSESPGSALYEIIKKWPNWSSSP